MSTWLMMKARLKPESISWENLPITHILGEEFMWEFLDRLEPRALIKYQTLSKELMNHLISNVQPQYHSTGAPS